jgi:hypothetical protein
MSIYHFFNISLSTVIEALASLSKAVARQGITLQLGQVIIHTVNHPYLTVEVPFLSLLSAGQIEDILEVIRDSFPHIDTITEARQGGSRVFSFTVSGTPEAAGKAAEAEDILESVTEQQIAAEAAVQQALGAEGKAQAEAARISREHRAAIRARQVAEQAEAAARQASQAAEAVVTEAQKAIDKAISKAVKAGSR